MTRRRVAAALLALLLVAAPARAQQHVTATGLVNPAVVVTTWSCSLIGIGATLTQCQAAPAAGLRLYVSSVQVQTTTATSGTFALQTGTGSNCGTGTAVFLPGPGSTTSSRLNAPINTGPISSMTFPIPLQAPAASAICMIGIATNTITIQINGFTAP